VPQPDGRVGLSSAVSDWAELTDGRRVVLPDGDLGYTSMLNTNIDLWAFTDAHSARASGLVVVLPNEDDGEDRPWAWLLDLLAEQGIASTDAELRAVPYEVELGTELLRRVSDTPSSASAPPA
jgi:hypothetical protein